MSSGRDSYTATQLPNGQILVAGGFSSDDPLASAELYDPVQETSSVTGSMITARYNHTATLLANGQVLVANGLSSGDATLTTAELYDPVKGTFNATPEPLDRDLLSTPQRLRNLPRGRHP
jgi:hypothetical protein